MRRNQHYHDRVNRVLDYIAQHLDSDLSLGQLSAIGCFSPFHFHRVFQGITGETLNTHVRRVRLERAALLLRTSPGRRITNVALETGFPGAAEFSRAFKQHFGRTASSWDRRSPLEKSKICKAPGMLSFHTVEELERWKADRNVKVRNQRFHAFRYVYTRIYAPYASTRLVDSYHALTAWLAQRHTDLRDVVFIGMSLDDPSITPAENCRYDLGIAFPRAPGGLLGETVRSRGRRAQAPRVSLPARPECDAAGLTIRDFEPRPVAAIRCAGDLAHVERAWHYLYRVWLPSHAYEPDDLPAMEMFVRLPEEIGWNTFDLQICIPVVRL